MAYQSAKPSLASIQADLADPDYKVRKEAIKALMRHYRKQAVEPLLPLLGDRRGDVRAKAAEALGKLKDMRSLVPLLGLPGDRSANVRTKVARALGNFGDPSAALPLQDMLNDPRPQVRQAAATSLGQLGVSSSLPALLDYLGRVWVDIHELEYATRAVSKFGTPGVVEPLLALCQRTYRVQGIVSEALSQLRESSTPLLLRILTDPTRRSEVRTCVARALTRKPRPGSLPALLQALSDREVRVRQHSALALGALGDSAALIPLIALLEANVHEDVRQAALQALSSLEAQEAADALIACLSSDHQDVVLTAVQALEKLKLETTHLR